MKILVNMRIKRKISNEHRFSLLLINVVFFFSCFSETEHSGQCSSRCEDEDDSEDDDSDNKEAAHSDAENDDQNNSNVKTFFILIFLSKRKNFHLESEYIVIDVFYLSKR